MVERTDDRLASAQVHWLSYGGPMFLLLLAGLGFFVLSRHPVVIEKLPDWVVLIQALSGLLAVYGLIWLLGRLIYNLTTKVFVTPTYLVIKTGILRRISIEQRLNKIDSITVDRPLTGIIFGYGTLNIRGSGVSMSPIRFIARPLRFKDAVNVAITAEIGRD